MDGGKEAEDPCLSVDIYRASADYALSKMSVCPSVCPSVTRWYSVEISKHIIKFFSASDND